MVASLLIVFGTSLYFWGIKPILYKKIVAHGKEELLSNFPAMPDKTSIKEAESLFKKALFFTQKILMLIFNMQMLTND